MKKKLKKINQEIIKKEPIKSHKYLEVVTGGSFMDPKNDPCFGKHYDLTTDECRCCGDSEFCAMTFSRQQKVVRENLENNNDYIDIQTKVNKKVVKSFIKMNIDKKTRKELILILKTKFKLTTTEARELYKEVKNK